MEKKLYAKLTVRLYTDEKCFGPGVAALLAGVGDGHSLRAAALSMEMAYSKAWKIIKQAEAGLGFPLLHSSVGGRGGGGATLTAEGARLLAAYAGYCKALEDCGESLFAAHFGDLALPADTVGRENET
ncbi:MAG: LysR family transcriptional regulator [Oscillospiraceae bacterium]